MNHKKGVYGQGGGNLRLPAIDFPAYQPSTSYDGPWWIEGPQSTREGLAATIWVGQQGANADEELLVGTLHRQRYRDSSSRSSPQFAVADLCLTTLVNAHRDRVGTVSDVLAYAYQHADWPTVTWLVDDEAVDAAVCRYDDRVWVGFTDALANAYLAAVGVGTEPDDLRFVRIEDSNNYGVDFTAPINPNDIGRPSS